MAESFGGRFLTALRDRSKSTWDMTYKALSELEASDRENFVELLKRAAPKDVFLPEEFRELARTWEPEQLAIVAIIATRAYNNGVAGGLGTIPPRAGRL